MHIRQLSPRNFHYGDVDQIDRHLIDQYRYAYIKDTYTGGLDVLEEFDGIIIQYSSFQFTTRLIKAIHTHPFIYLKPLFIHYNQPGAISTLLHKNCDGLIIDLDNAGSLTLKTKQIFEKVSRIKNRQKSYNFESKFLRFILFLFTRNISEILPITDKSANTGYSYLFINDLDTEQDGIQKYTLLEEAEREGYLQGSFFDYVHLCPECTHSHLIYREVCSKCHSPHLEEQSLIHHFRCATIKPEKAYLATRNDGNMVCPKCDHQLRHIGVDYDKPSSIYTCNRCQHQSQQIQIWAKCCNCDKDTPVEHLLKQEIRSYQVTEKDMEPLIMSERVSINTYINSETPAFSLKTLGIILKHRLAEKRVKPDCLGVIEFRVLNEIEEIVGSHNLNKFWNEIIQIVRPSNQTSLNEIAIDDHKLYFTLYQVDLKGAARITEQLTYLIQNLIEVNYKIKAEEILYNFTQLDPALSFQENIAKLHV